MWIGPRSRLILTVQTHRTTVFQGRQRRQLTLTCGFCTHASGSTLPRHHLHGYRLHFLAVLVILGAQHNHSRHGILLHLFIEVGRRTPQRPHLRPRSPHQRQRRTLVHCARAVRLTCPHPRSAESRLHVRRRAGGRDAPALPPLLRRDARPLGDIPEPALALLCSPTSPACRRRCPCSDTPSGAKTPPTCSSPGSAPRSRRGRNSSTCHHQHRGHASCSWGSLPSPPPSSRRSPAQRRTLQLTSCVHISTRAT